MEAEHSEYVTLLAQYDQLQDDYLHLQADHDRLTAALEFENVLPNPPDSRSKLPLAFV